MTETQKTNKELAEEIRSQFTPLVFVCPCEGKDEVCRQIIEENSGSVWQIRDTVNRIADYLENN